MLSLLSSWAKRWLGEEFIERLIAASGLRRLRDRFWRGERLMPDGNRIRCRWTDLCVIDEIYSKNAYGPAEAISEAEVVVDAGGHIGVFALWAARRVGPRGRVLVCEPSPNNLDLLRKKIKMGRLAQITLFDCALGEQEGEAELYVAHRSSDNSLADTLMPTAGRKAVRVAMRKLDSIVAREKLSRIDHLKIDVEGAELMVLRGAQSCLGITHRVILEAHPEKLDCAEVLAWLRQAGFMPRVLSRQAHSWLIEARRLKWRPSTIVVE